MHVNALLGRFAMHISEVNPQYLTIPETSEKPGSSSELTFRVDWLYFELKSFVNTYSDLKSGLNSIWPNPHWK